jgi:hypothetical protein
MNDDPSKVDVLYAKVREVDKSGRYGFALSIYLIHE